MNRLLFALMALAGWQSAQAHVPYIEDADYSPAAPLIVNELPVSKAYYGYLDGPDDVDIYAFEISEPTYIHATAAIPVCPEYLDFAVTIALVGPGLPEPIIAVPVLLENGNGALVVQAPIDAIATRPWYLEPYTKRHYFNLPDLDLADAPPGVYKLIVWNEAGRSGDYSFAIGPTDEWTPERLAQARKVGMQLAARNELHVSCDTAAAISQLTTEAAEGSGTPRYIIDPSRGLDALIE